MRHRKNGKSSPDHQHTSLKKTDYIAIYHYPLTDPLIAPDMKYLWENINTIIIGIIDKIEPTAINHQSDTNVPVNIVTPSGRVDIIRSHVMNTSHYRSSQTRTTVNNANIA